MINKKSNAGVILIVLGCIFLFLSIVSIDDHFISTVSHETYGGDAYTGIQNAAADTANNISKFADKFVELVSLVSIIMSSTLIGIGIAINRLENARIERHNLMIHQLQILQQSINQANPNSVSNITNEIQTPNLSTPSSPTDIPVNRFLNMKTCQTCGKHFPQHLLFCDTCGKKLDE